MEQVFRIEIPIEAVDKTDASALRQLESTLQKIFSAMQKNKASASDVFDAMEKGANEARSAMQKTAKAAEDAADSYDSIAEAAGDAGDEQANAASDAANAFVNIDTKLHTVTTGYKNVGDAASEAGRKASPAFTQAGENADAFTKRVEKSNQTLRKMFSDKFQLIMSAIDRASPILKSISGTVKGLVGKTWSVAVKMKDFVTAPFRKIWNMINSPITLALSVVGVGFSASDVLSTYNGFESQMSGVRALTGATGEDFLLLKETAKELGAETSFSASQAAEGMQNLASAGFTTSEIVAAMPGMLDLAASSGEDLAAASDIAATTLRGFCLEASEAAHVADVLAEVSARTNATVADTGEAMKYIAPIANAMGLSLEETAAAIGLLSDAGIKGSQAGTTLRGALSRLAKPTEDMLEVMDSLGLSFYDSNGQMKSISSIVGMLKNNMASLTEEQKQNALVTLFGQEALSGMMVLMEAGPEKLDELTRSLENCEGAASEMSEVRLDNLAGDMEELSGAVETAKLELMEKLDPYLRSAVQWLTTKIPIIQQKLEDMIDAGVEKAGELKEFISGVFSSDDYQNADGFAEKFFVAWDKIIAEPFEEWWSSGGERILLGKLADFGEGAGELLNGIITGIFAAIQGKDIDFEGLNITGLAKAGAEAGKTFVSSFLGGLDIGNIFDEMPGGLKAGLLGFGAFKIGQGGFGIAKTIGALKTAFSGAGAAASAAAPAVASVGAKATASAVGAGKATAVLGGLKTALAAIPVWGWVAAAAVAATAVGIKLYADAQERHRQEILHVGDAVEESSYQFQQSADQYREAVAAVEGYHEAQTELTVSFAPITDEDKQVIRETIEELEREQIELETILANGGLSETERMKLSAQILEIEADKIALTLTLETLPPAEIETLNQQIADIERQQIELKALIDEGGLPPEEVTKIERQIAELEAKKIELQAKIENGQISPDEVAALEQQITMLEQQKIDIQALIEGGGLSPDEAAALKKQIEDIETSQICLKAFIEPLTEDEIKVLTDKLAEIEEDKIEIQALIDGGGLPPEQVEALEEQIDDLNNKEVLIRATLGGLSDEEIAQYAAQQLGINYEQLVPVLNNTFGISLTVKDLETGAYDSLIENGAVEEVNRLNMEASLESLRGDVEAGRAIAPETIAEIARMESEIVNLEGQRTQSLETGGQVAIAQATIAAISEAYRADMGAFNRGEISVDEMHSRESAYLDRLYEDVWKNAYVDPYVLENYSEEEVRAGFDQQYDMGGSMDGFLKSLYTILGYDQSNSFETASDQSAQIEQLQSDIATAQAGLMKLYEGEKTLVAADSFAGTDYMGMSVEEIAARYPQIVQDLGAAGETMFQNMLAGLAKLNTQADYITAEQQTQTVDVIDIAAKADIMSSIQTQVQDIATQYQSMTAEQQAAFSATEEGAAQLAAVNEALSGLGLDQIDSLDQLNEALSALSTVDLSSFSLEAVQSAFSALGGDATGCKTKVDALRSSLEEVDGMNTSSTHTHTNKTINRTITVSGGRVSANANGGIYDGAFLSWVAEDGPEAIIPLGAKRRERGLELWLQAGKMLGVSEFAEGGIMAPYSGALERLPDEAWGDGEFGDGGSASPHLAVRGGGGAGHVVNVSVAANPTFQIEGGESSEDLLDKLKGKQKELAEIFGEAIAEQLEDIVSNMA